MLKEYEAEEFDIGEAEYPITEPEKMMGCSSACPVDVNGSPHLATCTLNSGHIGGHMCSAGHRW